MANLDELEIVISASSANATRAIDKLIGSLTHLNQSLNNYRGDSEYARAMNTLAGGLERVSRAINSINESKIKGVSSALNSLANSGKRINIAQGVAKETSLAEKRVDALAKKIASDFGVKGKGGVDALRGEISKLIADMDAAKGDRAARQSIWASGIKEIGQIASAYGKTENFAGMSAEIESVRTALKGLKWDMHDSAEFGDDLIRVFAKLGARNLGKGHTDAATIAEELNTQGFNFDTSSNIDAIRSIVDFLERAQQSQITWNEAVRKGGEYQAMFNERLHEAQSALKGEIGIKGGVKLSNAELGVSETQNLNPLTLEQMAAGLQAIKSVGELPDFSTLNGLAKNLTKLGETNSGKLAENLPPIANSLKNFEGLHIPDMSGFGGFAAGLKELNKLGKESATNASANLPKIAEGIKLFSGMQIPNLQGIDEFAKALRSLGTKNVGIAAESLKPIADGLREFQNVEIPSAEGAQSIAEFAKALRAFGSKSAESAVTNIPRLADAFNQLVMSINQGNIEEKTVQFAVAMAQLARSCEQAGYRMQNTQKKMLNWDNLFTMIGARVRQVVRGGFQLLTNSLRNLGARLSNAGQRLRDFAHSFFGIKKESEDASSSIMKLARAIGKFWASAFWIINAVRGLWKSVKSSMDYVETLNYFKAAFRQVSATAVGNWEKLGYDSAEAYADSFEKRAKQLTSKMTGFEISDTGILSMKGGKSLGLNPNTLLNYQAQFAQMASSMGASANNATLLSQALVEIGADLASVKNLKFEDVWNDMASGMVGMSRTLDKYGVNIRAAALNQKLLDLGINATIKDLSGADKALLRIIVLLDSTRYSWGDLARTINQPANQIRLLTANLQNCARMIGNIFLPIVAKVLPYLNAMTIAVQRLLTFIAQLLGIDISKITSSVGGAGDAMSDILDDTDDLEDGLDDAADSAKKLKNNLLGVDELNIISENITSQDANGAASSMLDDAFLDALSEYQKAWDAAFEAMENRANELADNIVKWFKNLFKPISDAWGKVGEDVKKAWEKAFTSLGSLIKSIFSDVASVWQNPINTEIFENLFVILKDIGLIVSNLADNFRKAWEEGGRGRSILESIQKIIWAISQNARDVADYFVGWSKDLNFTPILQSIDNFLKSIADNALNIVGIFADWYTIVWGGIGKYLIEEFFPKALDSLTKMVNMVDWEKLRNQIDGIYEALVDLAKIVGGWLLTAWDNLATALGKFLGSDYFGRLGDSLKRLVEDLRGAKNINDVINAIFDFTDDRAIDVAGIVNVITRKINEVLDNLDFKNLGARFAGVINTFLDNVNIDDLSDSIANIINGILDFVLSFMETMDWDKVGDTLGKVLRKVEWTKVAKIIWEGIKAAFEILFNGESTGESVLVTGILALLGANGITKALTGKGIAGNLIEKLFGKGAKGAKKETGALGALADAADDAVDGKTGVAKANKTLIPTTVKGAKGLEGEATAAGSLRASVQQLAKYIGALGLIITEVGAGNHFSQWYGKQIGVVENTDWSKWDTVAAHWKGMIDVFKNSTGKGESEQAQRNIEAITKTYEKMKKAYGKAEADKKFKDAYGMSFDEKIADEQAKGSKAWYEVGEDIVAGIGEGIVGATLTIFHPFAAVFDWVVNSIKSVFGIASPAKNVMFLGEYILLGIVEGFKAKFSAFFDAIGEFFANIKQWFSEKFEELKGWFSEKWNGLGETFSEAWENIRVAISTKWTELKDNFITFSTGFVDDVATWASNTWGEISTWVTNTKDAFADWSENVIGSVSDWFTNTYGQVTSWITDTKNDIELWAQQAWQKFEDWRLDVEGTIDTWRKNVEGIVQTWSKNIVGTLEKWYLDAKDAIANWFDETKKWFENWKTEVEGVIEGWKESIINKFEEWKNGVFRKLEQWKEGCLGWIGRFITESKQTVEKWSNEILVSFDNFKTWVLGVLSDWKEKALEFIDAFVKTKDAIVDWAKTAKDNIIGFAKDAKDKLYDFYSNGKKHILDFIEETKNKFVTWKTNTFKPIEEFVGAALKKFEDFYNDAKEWFTESKWSFDGIRDGLVEAFDTAFQKAAEMWQALKDWLSGLDLSTVFQALVGGIKDVTTKALEKAKNVVDKGKEVVDKAKQAVNGSGTSGSKTGSTAVATNKKTLTTEEFWDIWKNGRKWTFATGGFPEDGLFFANHNELVGSFSNGRTAVANNEQITEGIRQAVYDAFTAANGSNREEQLLEELIQAVRSGRSIQIDGRELVNAVNQRSTRNGFSFT